MKFHAAFTSAVVAAAATMAHANASVNVIYSKASLEAKNSAKALLEKHDFSLLVDSNLNDLAAAMKLEQIITAENRRGATLVAAFEGADSTTLNIYNPNLNSCYGNCYTNCHGSKKLEVGQGWTQ